MNESVIASEASPGMFLLAELIPLKCMNLL